MINIITKNYTYFTIGLCLCILTLVSPLPLLSQQIELKYAPSYYLCETNEFTFIIDNSQGLIQTGDTLRFQLDCHQQYLPGSHTFLKEEDITNLHQPVFTFRPEDISPSIVISILLDGNCQALECIDQAELPTINVSLITDTSTIQKQFPYELDEGLVLITNIEDIEMFANRGESINRRITIRNTKPGRTSRILLSDTHSEFMTVEMNRGQIISNEEGFIEIFLGANDFETIGNNDVFFDYEESLNITETIQMSLQII